MVLFQVWAPQSEPVTLSLPSCCDWKGVEPRVLHHSKPMFLFSRTPPSIPGTFTGRFPFKRKKLRALRALMTSSLQKGVIAGNPKKPAET